MRRTLRTAASSRSSCSKVRMRCSRYTSVLRWMKSCRAVAWRFCSCSRVNEALVSMWFNNSTEAGNWLIDKCAEFGVVPVSFRAHAPNAIIPESYDYHMFVNVGDHQFDSKCGYFAATNVLYEDSQNAEKYEHPATYFFNTKAQELLVEDGRVTGVFRTA